jgi:hypothetical protein
LDLTSVVLNLNPQQGMTPRLGLIVMSTMIGSLSLSSAPVWAKPAGCVSQRGGEKEKRIQCNVTLANGRIVAIRDLSDGGTFRVGQYGWTAVKNKPCLFNIESGSRVCAVNQTVKK